MCLSCEPYRPGHEDTTSTDEQGAARAEQERAEGGDPDCPEHGTP